MNMGSCKSKEFNILADAKRGNTLTVREAILLRVHPSTSRRWSTTGRKRAHCTKSRGDRTTIIQPEKKSGNDLPESENVTLLSPILCSEVGVLSPVEIEKITDPISRLESLPEVKTTTLISQAPNPLIKIFLNEPSPLAELRKTLLQVCRAPECLNYLLYCGQ